MALSDTLPHLTMATNYSGLGSAAEDNPPEHSREKALGPVPRITITTRKTRHLHMMPYPVLFSVPTAGGDYGPDYPLSASGDILPLWAHLAIRTRGDM
jgi:hypothetical protein